MIDQNARHHQRFATPAFETPAAPRRRAERAEQQRPHAVNGIADTVPGLGVASGRVVDLDSRLGTFLPPATGPGVTVRPDFAGNGVAAAAEAAVEARGERSSFLGVGTMSDVRPTGTAPRAAHDTRDTARAVPGDVARRGSRSNLFATPGLTPIAHAQQTPSADNAAEETPSEFLAGLLRGSPNSVAGGVLPSHTYGEETPVQDEVGVVRAAASRRPSTAIPGATGGAQMADEGSAVAPRAGRRRVGGRLSFSSAVAPDGGGGHDAGEGARGDLDGATEPSARVNRSQVR